MKNITKSKKTAVLIPTYNRKGILDISLKHIAKSRNLKNIDIFIIDNGSKDGTEELAKKYPFIHYEKFNRNFFISKALNKCVFDNDLCSKYDYLIIIANDVLVNRDTFTNIIEFLDNNPNVGITGPRHYDWLSKNHITDGLTVNRTTSLLQNFKPGTQKKINHFHSCYAVRSDVYKEIAGFQHVLYPMIYEEPDLGERVLREGYKIKLCATSKIWHPIDIKLKNIDTSKLRRERLYNNAPKTYLFFRNRIIYMSLYSSFIQFLLFYFIFNPLITVYYLASVDPKYLMYVLLGLVDGTKFALFKDKKFIKGRNKYILNL